MSDSHLELPQTEACMFCEQIAARPASFQVLEETRLTVTFLTLTQLYEVGQALVIPRRQ